jgi:demethylmenaquinone methyltransferase/2-methoxy-6-polyprenyl-1,4-benzoquinol methylase
MFDGISRSYDLLNHLLSFGRDKRWRKRAVQALEVRPKDRILDIACGTGDMLTAIKAASPSLFAVGCDFSTRMVKVAKKKDVPAPLVVADACALPFEEGVFDKITLAFGFRNIPNKTKALNEAHRVLKTGGVLSILEFSKPKSRLFSALYWFYFKYILPLAGALISGHKSAYSYLPESVKNFPDDSRYLAMVTEAGFTGAKLTPYDFGICSLLTAEKRGNIIN